MAFLLMKTGVFDIDPFPHFQVDAAISNVQKFSGIVKLQAFDPFKNTEAALENCNAISEG